MFIGFYQFHCKLNNEAHVNGRFVPVFSKDFIYFCLALQMQGKSVV